MQNFIYTIQSIINKPLFDCCAFSEAPAKNMLSVYSTVTYGRLESLEVSHAASLVRAATLRARIKKGGGTKAHFGVLHPPLYF